MNLEHLLSLLRVQVHQLESPPILFYLPKCGQAHLENKYNSVY